MYSMYICVCVCKQYMYKQINKLPICLILAKATSIFDECAVIFVTGLEGFRKSAFLAGKTVLDQHMAHLNWQSNFQ